eukprot:3306743-Pleurochrysis_carterae.AAC.3
MSNISVITNLHGVNVVIGTARCDAFRFELKSARSRNRASSGAHGAAQTGLEGTMACLRMMVSVDLTEGTHLFVLVGDGQLSRFARCI